MTIYNFKVQTIDGEEASLEQYRGKVVLIVNTASKCGLVTQLEGLEELYQAYKGEEFVILGFPCNQFLGQEPLEGEEITEFCQLNYGVSFPLFEKIKVNGKQTHPLYVHLKEETGGKMIKWNYTKFLVNREGEVVERFSPRKKPEDLKDSIEKLL